MSFRVPKSETFLATVKTATTDETGRRVTGDFKGVFKRLSITEIKEIGERHKDDELPDYGFLSEVMTGWKELGGDDDQPLEWSLDNLKRMVDAGFSTDMIRAFYDNLPGARAKN